MNIQIKTHNRELGLELMGTPDSFTAGTTRNLPGNAILQANGIFATKMFGAPITFDLILILNPNSNIAIISEWFYLQLSNRCEQMVIDGNDINIITMENINEALALQL